MRMILVQSSLLSAVGYDPSEETMVVQFQNGRYYRYNGVPADVFVSVITDPDSQGKAFNSHIKAGVYPYKEVTAEEVGVSV